MKLNSKRTDFEYMSSEEVSTSLGDTRLPFFSDVDEELTDNPSAMGAMGETLDGAETLVEKAKTVIEAALANESNLYHDLVTFFTQPHRDDVGPDITADFLPRTNPTKPSPVEVVDPLRLKRFGSLVDGKTGQQAFILDPPFNPEITDELMVVYFDLNKEIFCITHES